MRKLKISKNRLSKALAATLIVLGLTVVSVKVTTDLYHLSDEVVSLKGHVDDQNKKISSMELDLRSINGGNGNLLSKCLDTAGREYNNSIQSSGRTVVENGANTTYHDMSTWKKLNDKLEADRAKCNEQYK